MSRFSGTSTHASSDFAASRRELPPLISGQRGIPFSLLRCLMCAKQLLSCEELKQSSAQNDLMDEQ